MKKILFALLSVMVFFLFACKDDENKNNQTNTKDTINYPNYEEFTADDNQQNQNKNNTLIIEDTTSVVTPNDNVMVEDNQGNTVPATNEELNDQNKNFYIVVGSYKKQDNAQIRMTYFKNMGYTAEVLPLFGQYYRVSVANFNEETTARTELKNLRTKFKDPSFWLLYR